VFDGVAGSGKTITAIEVANKLNFIHLDTGAMYRAITLFFVMNKIKLIKDIDLKIILKNINISVGGDDLKQIILNDIDVTDEIRSKIINNTVSKISALRDVREKLILEQRKIASNKKNIVIEGRDIGTIVFPEAEYKFYLTANIEARAKRRFLEMKNITYEEILDNLILRDKKDINRKYSPLKVAKDAIVIDTTHRTIINQVNKIISYIK
jgi:cytidylate kinase